MFCRHGTRYPDRNTILKMLNLTHIRDLIIDNHKIHKRKYICTFSEFLRLFIRCDKKSFGATKNVRSIYFSNYCSM